MSDTRKQVERVTTAAPAYCEIGNDGADWRCKECGELGAATDMLFVATPSSTWNGVYHRNCVDQTWLKTATKIEGKI